MGMLEYMHTPENHIRFMTDEYARRQDVFYRKWLESYPVSGYVYLIKVLPLEDTYKIGKTTTPYKRLGRFDVNLPYNIYIMALIECLDCSYVEKRLHAWFAPKRVGGEFFVLDGVDIANIKLTELFMEPPQGGRKDGKAPDFSKSAQQDFFRFIDLGGGNG